MLLLDVLDAMPKHSRERLVGTVLRSSSTSCVAPSCVIVMIPCIITYPQSFSLLFFFLVSCITWAQKCPSPICNLPVAWLPGFFFFFSLHLLRTLPFCTGSRNTGVDSLICFLISLVTVLIVTIITLIIFFSCTSSLHFFFSPFTDLVVGHSHHPPPHSAHHRGNFNFQYTSTISEFLFVFFWGECALSSF